MKTKNLLLALSLSLAAAPALAGVTVTFTDPTKFTDVEDKNSTIEFVTGELKAHLEKMGAERLAPGKNVTIEIFNIDRAGRPRAGKADIRIMTGKTDAPCIDVNAGQEGTNPKQERICDLDYLRALPAPYHTGDPLVFEKRMLDEWFRLRVKNSGWDKAGKGATP